ncbi:MAG: cryptochrome/photolyase family protein [Amphiplicatus sp.]|nr:cryptochrome/photolyase family protein [Amphiplicatus sp.]
MSRPVLRVVLGDQLTPSLAALRNADRARDVVLMMEVAEEATYVPHHKKKLAFIFSAMRAFASELRGAGWIVDYVRLSDPANTGSFLGEISRSIERHGFRKVVYVEPGERRVVAMFETLRDRTDVEFEVCEDDRFICSKVEFDQWAETRKHLRMEHFYREMRRKTRLLMDGDEPIGGRWNFDSDNRKRIRKDLLLPQPLQFEPSEETAEVLKIVDATFDTHFGELKPFWFPVTRSDAERAAEAFLRHSLPGFGDYQDAMIEGEKFLFHSVLSPLLNVGLLDPLDLCRRAQAEYAAGRAPLNSVEGFIRQIIGWREYVRGIYWLKGPEYIESNALNATRRLPEMYWTGETDMACMAAAIRQTKEEAYAHHIQRLMVTGNFALLMGIAPHEVHEWYLAVYADAFEWVEAPNTIGMSQYADGGLLASKPYAASGAYINRMSDYCKRCRYDVKAKTGEWACPFNALYWDFIARCRSELRRNPRMAQIVRAWEKMTPDDQLALRARAASFIEHVENFGTDL